MLNQIISDVMIAFNNSEKQAVAALSSLTMVKYKGGLSTFCKPQSIFDLPNKREKLPPLTDKETKEIVSRWHVG